MTPISAMHLFLTRQCVNLLSLPYFWVGKMVLLENRPMFGWFGGYWHPQPTRVQTLGLILWRLIKGKILCLFSLPIFCIPKKWLA
jgi:hypothetical protein